MKANLKEKESLLMDNQRLIHYFLKKKGFQPSHPDYEDLFQDCNLRCWRAIQKFDPERGTLSTYLGKVCFNAIGSYLRTKRRKPNPEIYLDSEVNPWAEFQGNSQTFRHEMIPDPDTEAEFLELRLFNSLSISKLKYREKQAILLSWIGYNQEESAELIGVSQPQVSRFLSKARRELERGVA